jgi:hypothetical protein
MRIAFASPLDSPSKHTPGMWIGLDPYLFFLSIVSADMDEAIIRTVKEENCLLSKPKAQMLTINFRSPYYEQLILQIERKVIHIWILHYTMILNAIDY